MKFLTILAVAAVTALPMLIATAPAEAATAGQYEQQGRGHYTYSNRPSRQIYHRHHRRYRHHR